MSTKKRGKNIDRKTNTSYNDISESKKRCIKVIKKPEVCRTSGFSLSAISLRQGLQ